MGRREKTQAYQRWKQARQYAAQGTLPMGAPSVAAIMAGAPALSPPLVAKGQRLPPWGRGHACAHRPSPKTLGGSREGAAEVVV